MYEDTWVPLHTCTFVSSVSRNPLHALRIPMKCLLNREIASVIQETTVVGKQEFGSFRKTRGMSSKVGTPTMKCKRFSIIAASTVPEPKEYIPQAIKKRTPLILHHLSGLLVIIFSRVWKTTVAEQKATVATKLANVNNTGGNMVLDCLSHGAHGVSMPTPKVNTPAPNVASAPMKSNGLAEALKAFRYVPIMGLYLSSQYICLCFIIRKLCLSDILDESSE